MPEELHPKVRKAALKRLNHIRDSHIWHKAWLATQGLGKTFRKVHDWWTEEKYDFETRVDNHEIGISIYNGNWSGFWLDITFDGALVFRAQEADEPDDLRWKRDKDTDIYPEDAKIKIPRGYDQSSQVSKLKEILEEVIEGWKTAHSLQWIRINQYTPGEWEKYLDYQILLEAHVFTAAEDLAKREAEEKRAKLAKPLSDKDKSIAEQLGIKIDERSK